MKKFMLVLFASSLLVSCSKDDEGSSVKEIVISEVEITADAITVEWPKVEGAVYYEIEITPKTEDDIYMVEGNTSFTFSDLLADTDYEISVKAGTSLVNENVIAEGKKSLKTLTLPKELLGSWKYQYKENSIIYTFKSDGTGTLESRTKRDIKWNADVVTITITVFEESGTSQTFTYDYSIEDVDLLKMDGTYYYLEE